MLRLTLIVGLFLIVFGVFSYVTAGSGTPETTTGGTAAEVAQDASETTDTAENPAGDKRSITALIPAFIGLPITVCGLVALEPSLRKHAMHGMLLFALLGALGGLGMGLPKLPAALQGESERPKAVYAQITMGIPCAILLVAGINSFLAARRKRSEEAQEAPTEQA